MSFGKEPPDIEASATTVAEACSTKFTAKAWRIRGWIFLLGIPTVIIALAFVTGRIKWVSQYPDEGKRGEFWYLPSQSANREFLTAIANLKTLGSFNDRQAVSKAIGVDLKEKIDSDLEGRKGYSFVSPEEGHWWKSIIVQDDLRSTDKELVGNKIGSVSIDIADRVCVLPKDVDGALGINSVREEEHNGAYMLISYNYKPIKVYNGYLTIFMFPQNLRDNVPCIRSIGMSNQSNIKTGER